MSLIINPGSQVGGSGEGWTNTLPTAKNKAREWLQAMHDDGLVDVQLLDETEYSDGRWLFSFAHRVTGVIVKLEIDGIDDLVAYKRDYLFPPRIYWNGSSCSNPKLEDWAAPGYALLRTFTKVFTKS
jgi:hypothetical protein